MPFGLTNASSVLQQYLNNILVEKIDQGVVVYINDLVMYSNQEEENIELVR